MCSYNKFPECAGGKPHEWRKIDPIRICLEDSRGDKRIFFSCVNCDTQVNVDGLLPARSSIRYSPDNRIIDETVAQGEVLDLAHTC